MDDLDALLAEAKSGEEAKRQSDLGRDRAFGRGMLQGATMGFGDELAGALGAHGTVPVPKLQAAQHPELFPNGTADEIYTRERDAQRRANATSETERPWYYRGGQVAGALLAAPLIPGLAAAKGAGIVGRLGINAANGLLQGGVFGAGSSDADLAKGQLLDFAKDTGIGLLFGGGLGLGAGILGEGAQSLANRLGKRAAAFTQKAADAAETQEGKVTSAATGTAGSVTQKANRAVENRGRLLDNGNLRPDQIQTMNAQQAKIAELEQKLADSVNRDIPQLAAQKEAADALAEEAVLSHPQRVQLATAEKLSASEAGRHIKAIAKRYWPEALGTVVGHLVPGLGPLTGALGTRAMAPAFRAISKRMQAPVFQRALALGGQKVAGGFADVLQSTGTPAALEGSTGPGLLPSMRGAPAMAQSDDLDTILAEAKALHAAQASRGPNAPQ